MKRKFYRKDSKDMTGKVFGKLTAISPVRIKGERGLRWLCKCQCGKEKVIHGGHLRAGTTNSCGCLALDKIEESAKSELYGRYMAKAKKRTINFELSRNEFDSLIIKNCRYCGSLPSQYLKNSRGTHTGFYNGIDRFDNTKGYTKENSVPCCKICNVMKYNLTFEDWLQHIKKVIANV